MSAETTPTAPSAPTAGATAPSAPPARPAEWGLLARLATASNVALQIVAALALLVGVVYISKKYYNRYDTTRSRAYSLSDKTRTLITSLKKPVTILTLWARVRGGNDLTPEIIDKVDDLLDEYKGFSSQIIVKALPAVANQELAEKIIKDLDVKGPLDFNQMVVKCGDRQKIIRIEETFEADMPNNPYGGGAATLRAFKGEEVLTSSIRSVSEDRKMTVYFLEGHKEANLADSAEGGALMFKGKLETAENYAVKKWNSLKETTVPADCDLLIVPSPRARFQPEELQSLRAYFGRGGRVLCLMDPHEADASPGLDPLFREWGVEVTNGILVEPSPEARVIVPLMGGFARGAIQDAAVFIGSDMGGHQISAKLINDDAPIFELACGVDQAAGAAPDVTVTPLVKTSPESFLRTDLTLQEGRMVPGKDKAGPVTIAVAVEKQLPGDGGDGAPRKARAVVIGDGVQVQNHFYKQFDRCDLVLNAARWLLEQENLITIEPKKPEEHKLSLVTADQITWVQRISLYVLPLAAIGLALFTWLLRRA